MMRLVAEDAEFRRLLMTETRDWNQRKSTELHECMDCSRKTCVVIQGIYQTYHIIKMKLRIQQYVSLRRAGIGM